ncbi:MAG: hypothetical protein HFH50_13075 [Lachnospiraceae bacterium]|jgi:hypothetical protein|nr:hypothetical protein [Lachnospiraceae bacterium]
MKQEDFTALGISEELAKKAAEASKKELEGFIPKSRFDEVNEAKKTLEEDVKARDKQLEELKKSNGDNETLQGQIKKLQDSNKAEKERYESELKSLKIANAVKLAVNGKVHDEDLVAGLIDKEKLVIDENGGIIGLEEQVKSLQEKKAFLFKSEDTGSYKPQNGGKPSNNPFAKETFNLTEQGKLLRENPAQAKEMAAAAGVMI